jgi:glycosyltransferase involved in cell wall biosynthesis
LTLPASDSLEAQSMRQHWPPLAGPYSWYFNRTNVETLLFKSGFDRLTTWQVGSYPGMPAIPGRATLAVLAHKRDVRQRLVVSVIVPVYNEVHTFPRMFSDLYSLDLPGIDKEIIIVESGSTDGTADAVERVAHLPGVHLLSQDRPHGKGSAVRAGLSVATGDFVIIQDADLEYDFNDYPMLLEPLVRGTEAFVIGSRHATTGWKIRSFDENVFSAFTLNVGHVVFTALVNSMFHQRLADPFSMFKVFRRDCLFGLSFECNRFDFDYELLIKLIRKGYAPAEIPVNYSSRSFGEGKKVSVVRDPITWLRVLARLKRQPTETFLSRPPL